MLWYSAEKTSSTDTRFEGACSQEDREAEAIGEALKSL